MTGVRTTDTITLAHGSGGRIMQTLIQERILRHFPLPPGAALEDQARLPLAELGKAGDRLAMTTDSYVVDPLFFPGGDIGKLAVVGTVNDLVVGGAQPRALSLGLILEEGLPLETLDRVLHSAALAAEQAGVGIVTGDTKVVPRGQADQLFINTTGVGVIPAGREPSVAGARPGDVVLVNGDIGRHGAAIFACREELRLEAPIESDCAALGAEVEAIFAEGGSAHCLRDATRGGLAAVLNEIAVASGVQLCLEEAQIPLHPAVRGLAELLGLDPLHLACEGRLVAVVPGSQAAAILQRLRATPGGQGAQQIGLVVQAGHPQVTMRTEFGGERIVDMLAGEPLPRIC